MPIPALGLGTFRLQGQTVIDSVRNGLAVGYRAIDTALAQAEERLREREIVSSGDIYAITCGEPMGSPGGTNMLKICRVG